MTIEELNALLAGEDAGAAIDALQKGRPAPLPAVDKYTAELDPMAHGVMNPSARRDKWVKIDDKADAADPFEEAAGKVRSTDGGKWRSEPVNRIALALQRLIVERAVSFTFGSPVTLNAEPAEGTREADVLNAVRRVLFEVKARTVNKRVARAVFSCTEAAELWYPVQKENDNYGFKSKLKLRCVILDPMQNRLYPYFDDTGDMIAFSREYDTRDDGGRQHTYFETYTDSKIVRWERQESGWEAVQGYPVANALGKIPVVYGRQPEVEWRDVQSIIDRLEKLLSNFADTNDYFASPKAVVTGDIVGWAKKGDAGSVIEMDEGGKVEYLTWDQAPEAVKLEIDTALKFIYTLTQTPDISFDNVKGINSISGVALKLLFSDAHLKVHKKMEIFDDYLQRRISVIQSFLKSMNLGDSGFALACDSLMIEPQITPYVLSDEGDTVNTLLAATGQKAIASRKKAVQKLGWVKDADEEIARIEQEEGSASLSSLIEQEPTR